MIQWYIPVNKVSTNDLLYHIIYTIIHSILVSTILTIINIFLRVIRIVFSCSKTSTIISIQPTYKKPYWLWENSLQFTILFNIRPPPPLLYLNVYGVFMCDIFYFLLKFVLYFIQLRWEGDIYTKYIAKRLWSVVNSRFLGECHCIYFGFHFFFILFARPINHDVM